MFKSTRSMFKLADYLFGSPKVAPIDTTIKTPTEQHSTTKTVQPFTQQNGLTPTTDAKHSHNKKRKTPRKTVVKYSSLLKEIPEYPVENSEETRRLSQTSSEDSTTTEHKSKRTLGYVLSYQHQPNARLTHHDFYIDINENNEITYLTTNTPNSAPIPFVMLEQEYQEEIRKKIKYEASLNDLSPFCKAAIFYEAAQNQYMDFNLSFNGFHSSASEILYDYNFVEYQLKVLCAVASYLRCHIEPENDIDNNIARTHMICLFVALLAIEQLNQHSSLVASRDATKQRNSQKDEFEKYLAHFMCVMTDIAQKLRDTYFENYKPKLLGQLSCITLSLHYIFMKSLGIAKFSSEDGLVIDLNNIYLSKTLLSTQHYFQQEVMQRYREIRKIINACLQKNPYFISETNEPGDSFMLLMRFIRDASKELLQVDAYLNNSDRWLPYICGCEENHPEKTRIKTNAITLLDYNKQYDDILHNTSINIQKRLIEKILQSIKAGEISWYPNQNDCHNLLSELTKNPDVSLDVLRLKIFSHHPIRKYDQLYNYFDEIRQCVTFDEEMNFDTYVGFLEDQLIESYDPLTEETGAYSNTLLGLFADTQKPENIYLGISFENDFR